VTGAETAVQAEARAVALAPAAPPAAIAPTDQVALLRLARSLVAHRLGVPLDGKIPAMSTELLRRTDRVFVTLWVDGRMRGCHGASDGAFHQNLLKATRKTLDAGAATPLSRGDYERLRIEVDVLGAPAPFRACTPEEVDEAVEPGIHGLVAESAGKRALFRSSVAITHNLRSDELVRRLCEKGGLPAEGFARGEVELSRFRSIAFIEAPGAGHGAQELFRGNRVIGPGDWSRERITTAICAGAEYIARAQRADGGFVYEYDPATNQYAQDDNLVRQLATVWLVAQLSRRDDTVRSRETLGRALPYVLERRRRLPGPGGLFAVCDDGGEAWLGSIAFALLALVAADAPELRRAAEDLADTILSLQRADGGFDTELPAATQAKHENFFPGEAMLALMHLHARYPQPRYVTALQRALPYYRAHFRRQPSTAFVAWQMAAYANLFRFTGDRDHADFVFELADFIVPQQHVGPNVPYSDYVGGYRARRAPGVPSATFNEGVLEAYDIAKRVDDRERAAWYQRAGLLAALFTLRLQFTGANTYYLEHADRALGAFRASLVDSALRIDHTQHALNSLLKAERLLFPAVSAASRRGTAEPERAASA
jgi:AMMECR1 domain-containing protein